MSSGSIAFTKTNRIITILDKYGAGVMDEHISLLKIKKWTNYEGVLIEI